MQARLILAFSIISVLYFSIRYFWKSELDAEAKSGTVDIPFLLYRLFVILLFTFALASIR